MKINTDIKKDHKVVVQSFCFDIIDSIGYYDEKIARTLIGNSIVSGMWKIKQLKHK